MVAMGDAPVSDDAEMSARFCITTADEDLDGEVIVTKGIQTELHRQNPVVYFNHGVPAYGGLPTPIAISEDKHKSYSVQLGDGRGYGTAHFNSAIRESVQFYDLVKHGFLRAASIGAKPVPGTIQKMANGRLRFNQTTLHEWSIVGVGANPNAVRSKLRDGKIAGDAISDDLRKCLQPIADTATESVTGGFEMPKIDPDLSAKFPDDFLVPGDRAEVLIRATSDPVCKALLLKTADDPSGGAIDRPCGWTVPEEWVTPVAGTKSIVGKYIIRRPNGITKSADPSKGDQVVSPPPERTPAPAAPDPLTVKNETGLPLDFAVQGQTVTITKPVAVVEPPVEVPVTKPKLDPVRIAGLERLQGDIKTELRKLSGR
jgi:hypothetical protein